VQRPETRFALSGDAHIAYQVVGSGAFDLVYVPGWLSNVALNWQEPSYARFLERLASFARLILFDKRGTMFERSWTPSARSAPPCSASPKGAR
jgi:hypothetical protein